jgi:hypothetical protein
LATPNYGYEKRQRELAKKKKKEEKLKAKAEGKRPGDDGAGDELSQDSDTPNESPAGDQGPAPSN